ncbi:MAG: hypothetical protein ACF8R7_14460 [Phycisphaerales bacterium JB039]
MSLLVAVPPINPTIGDIHGAEALIEHSHGGGASPASDTPGPSPRFDTIL